MAKALEFASKLWLGEEGATMVEYALLAFFVAVACFTAVSALGLSLMGLFQRAVNGFG